MFLCCYLPYECDMFYEDYCFYLDKFKCIIESAETPYVYILGDFNADIQSQSIFGSELIEFCDMYNMSFIDKSMQNFVKELEELNIYDQLETPLKASNGFQASKITKIYDFFLLLLFVY